MTISGAKVLLPDTPAWQAVGEEGILVGRNPYSAKKLQALEKETQIGFSDDLSKLSCFQYTLTRYSKTTSVCGPLEDEETLQAVENNRGNIDINGRFFKGMLGVIEDREMFFIICPQKINRIL